MQLTEKLEGNLGEITVLASRYYNDNSRPYVVYSESELALEKIGDNLVIDPFFGLFFKENPFVQAEREYPIELIYLRNKTVTTTLTLPEGYSADLPAEPIRVSNDLLDMNIDFLLDNNTLKITGSYLLKKVVYPPRDYSRLKGLFDYMVLKFNKELILKPLE